MDTLNIIITTFSTIIGLVGGGVGVFFWKEKKRSQQIDNELKEANEWNKLYHEMANEKQKRSEHIKALYGLIDELKEDKAKLEMWIEKERFEVEKLKWHKCIVNGCPNRRPPHDHENESK